MKNTILKQWQLDIIRDTNPAPDEYHTWIRELNDILIYSETLQDPDWLGWENNSFMPDYTAADAKTALKTGKITIYSSYPIKQGIFVTPSKMEAQSYSETGYAFCKTVSLTDVAWIDPTQGQYTGPMP